MPEIQVKNKLITLEELGIAYNNITPANIGAVNKTGDTMTGYLALQNSTLNVIHTTKGNLAVSLIIDSNGNAGLHSNGYWNGNSFVTGSKWLINRDTAGKVVVADHYNKDETVRKIEVDIPHNKSAKIEFSSSTSAIISLFYMNSGAYETILYNGYGVDTNRQNITILSASKNYQVSIGIDYQGVTIVPSFTDASGTYKLGIAFIIGSKATIQQI